MDNNLIYIATHADEIFSNLIWPDGPTCPFCHSHNYYILSDGRYKCRDCGKIYSIKTNTVLHGSHLPISYWLVTLYLMLTNNGISSHNLSRQLGITQKTAYYMLIRLRYSMNQDDIILGDNIAMDEAYLGGTWRNFSLKKRNLLLERYMLPKKPKTIKEKMAIADTVNSLYKTPVFGMNDGERIVLKTVGNPVKPGVLVDIFNKHSGESGVAVSDCSRLYDNWEEKTGYRLETNNHSKLQFITESGLSSNRIEGEFSWLKRRNVFCYVHIKREYTQLYLNEFVMRWNCRNMNVEDKLKVGIKKICQKLNGDILVNLNRMENKLYKNKNWFNPVEFFRSNGGLINEIMVGGVVYRSSEFGF